MIPKTRQQEAQCRLQPHELPTGKRFGKIQEFRQLLEPAATAAAARTAFDALIARLDDLKCRMAERIEEGTEASYPRFAQLHASFRAVIAEACGNDVMADALRRLHAHAPVPA